MHVHVTCMNGLKISHARLLVHVMLLCLQIPLPARFPHTDVKLTLQFTAPSKTREHISTWRAQLPDGTFIGNEFTLELYAVKKIGATMVKDLQAE